MSRPDTTNFIRALHDALTPLLTTYYEEAPATGASFPYAVIGGIAIHDMEPGDLVLFDVDVWGDEREAHGEWVETLCDEIRAVVENFVFRGARGDVWGHIGFESQTMPIDKEFDLIHRTLSFSARVFYS